MNSPSKPPGHLFSKATAIMREQFPRAKRHCETCGKPCDLPGAKACNGCWEVESRLAAYATSVNGRIKLKRAIERAEDDLAARTRGMVR
jgi:hypothetical protein